jgi:hypothetical protein
MPNDTYVPRGSHPVAQQPRTWLEAAANPARLIVPGNTARRGVTIHNIGGGDAIYYGFHAGVTETDGFRLQDGESQPIGDCDNPIYAYCASGTIAVQVVET